MISFESDKDQRKQFREMTKELDDYILELYDKKIKIIMLMQR